MVIYVYIYIMILYIMYGFIISYNVLYGHPYGYGHWVYLVAVDNLGNSQKVLTLEAWKRPESLYPKSSKN